MPKFTMKLKGKAYVSKTVTVEAPDLDSAVDQAEKDYAEITDDWEIDEMMTRGPDAVQVVTGSWKRIDLQ